MRLEFGRISFQSLAGRLRVARRLFINMFGELLCVSTGDVHINIVIDMSKNIEIE